MVRGLTIAFFSLTLVASCVGWFRFSAGYDTRNIVIQSLNVFNQRLNPLAGGTRKIKPWKGDWIFRRERLFLVDNALRGLKPDLLIMQEMLDREGSPSEADDKILLAGALTGYEFDVQTNRSHIDTGEEEYLGVSLTLPLKFMPTKDLPKRRFWSVGKDGGLMLSMVMSEDQPVSVFNVLMPTQSEADLLWYDFIRDRIVEHFRESKLCPKRLIVAGDMPFGEGPLNAEAFMTRLFLKDPVPERCASTSACDTTSNSNEIFNLTMNNEEPQRTERILVHQDTAVYDSARRFDEKTPASKYVAPFGLENNFPSRTYGWTITARMPRCRSNEVWED